MCTAITYKTEDFYFGRTLDYEFSYNEEVTVTPRNYKFKFTGGKSLGKHYAIIGMAYVVNDYPLYYDGMNEKGLCMAGLNFVGNAHYEKVKYNAVNVAQFEFLPFILTQCSSVKEARELISKINITDTPFSKDLPPAQLHWMLADTDECITIESVEEGIKVYDNPVGVLTNNPSFPEQMLRLNDYMALSPHQPQNNFSDKLDLATYSRGMGAIGLPGDLSSQSRFVRASFVKCNSISGNEENESVGQFFHILGAVEQQRGCCEVAENEYEITIYTSCCNADKGIYYYTSYGNRQITAVDMKKENIDGKNLIRYALVLKEQINMQN